MKYCANCETESTRKTELGTPLCETCYTAYEWGKAARDGFVFSITDEKAHVLGEVKNNTGLDVSIVGYGTFDQVRGPVVHLEYKGGEVYVVIFDNIESGEAKIISLAKARES